MSYYLRFAIYLIAVLISLFFVWFSLKTYAENQPVSNYQTEFVKELKTAALPIQWNHITDSSANTQFQWFEATFADNEWTIPSTSQKLSEQQANSQTQFQLLQIEFNSPHALPKLREILNEQNRWKKTLICSRADGILKDLRELEPEWSFCSGEILMTRLLGLSSIGLGAMISIKPDVFFIHLKNIPMSDSLLSAIQEAKRQNKLVFVGPVPGPLEGYAVDGWMVKK